MTPVEEIKEKIKLEDVIGESLTVVGRGRTLTTKEHDSLKIFTATQTWHQFSSGQGGDIFDWWQREQRCDFRQALEALAQRAGVELRPMSDDERRVVNEDRREVWRRFEIWEMAASYYEAVLWSPAGSVARDYCAGRGWDAETIRRERIGFAADFSSTDNKALSVQELGIKNQESGEIVPLHRQLREAGLAEHPLTRAVLSVPAGMIVYCHRDERGRVVYLSGRSVEGKKRHFNMPEETAGAKQAYLNEPVKRQGGDRVMVEGQADAISFGMMGVTAVALCGMAVSALPGKFSHVALDNDAAAQKKNSEAREPGQVARALELALSVDPLCKVVLWPTEFTQTVDGQAVTYPIKDANDMLRVAPGPVEECLEDAPYAVVRLADEARRAKGEDRKVLMDRFFAVYTALDEMVATDLKPDLARALGQPVGQFNRLLKAHKDRIAKTQESPSGERFEYSAGGAQGPFVWEQCIVWSPDGKGTTQFAVRLPGGEIKYQKSVDVGGVTYIPYQPNLGLIRNRRIVLFPEKAEEYGTEKALNEEIRAFIHDYLDVDPFYERLASYYVMFTWLYDLFENLPYLRALGDYGTGKTRFIQTIGVMCYRPMLVSGASSVSPIFRLIDMFRGTLVVDEADLSNSDSDNEIVKIINVGYQKGGAVMRAEKDPEADIYAPEVYDVFGPKILATRKPFTDRAVESRCLTRRTTTQRPRPDIPYTLGEAFWRRSQVIRNKLLMYRLKNHRPIEIDHKLADTSVEPRLNQVTMALKTIITDESMRRDIDMFIRAYNDVLISDRQMTLPAVVVQALVDIHHSKKVNLLGQDERDFTMKGIADRCNQIMQDFDPDMRIHPRVVSKTLSDDLGLLVRKKHPILRRDMIEYNDDELKALMQRFGIEAPQQI